MEHKDGGDDAEDGLKGEQEDGVGGGKDLLGEALNGEGGGGGEEAADEEGDGEGGGGMQVRMLEREGEEHEEGGEADLKSSQ